MKRIPSNLSQSLHQRLNAYALAASAAGVGMAVLAQPASARIVYTPTDQQIETFNLDLNHDGADDFRFVLRGTPHTEHFSVRPVRHTDNEIWGSTALRWSPWAAALYAGVPVGPSSKKLNHHHNLMDLISTGGFIYYFGFWKNVTDRYLGLRFRIKGKNHYGWARLSVTTSLGGGIQGTLTGYAYETIPNKPIVTGKTKGRDVITVHPSSLGVLAVGASKWRNKQ